MSEQRDTGRQDPMSNRTGPSPHTAAEHLFCTVTTHRLTLTRRAREVCGAVWAKSRARPLTSCSTSQSQPLRNVEDVCKHSNPKLGKATRQSNHVKSKGFMELVAERFTTAPTPAADHTRKARSSSSL